MVLLTMTSTIVASINFCNQNQIADWPPQKLSDDPQLDEPALGKPISHTQVIALSRCLRTHVGSQHDTDSIKDLAHDLDTLLRGSKVHIEPPKPKAEPTSEYVALMARLRKEEEARVYERMINPPLPTETFAQRFPTSSSLQLFPESATSRVEEDDEITFADINRQMALIINVLLSIVACSVAIWMAASHWSTPSRLGLSMGGSGVVGVAEVAVYTGYIRRIKEAKTKAKKKVEVKEIMKTWVIGSSENTIENEVSQPIDIPKKQDALLRRRWQGSKDSGTLIS